MTKFATNNFRGFYPYALSLVFLWLIVSFPCTLASLLGVYVAPLVFALLLTTVIAWFAITISTSETRLAVKLKTNSVAYVWPFALLTLLTNATAYEEIRKAFRDAPIAKLNSDVFIQIEFQSRQFLSGNFPYLPEPSIFYHPFPAYMPLHWLPISFCHWAHIDPRWSAPIVYTICATIAVAALCHLAQTSIQKILIAVLPAILLWLHIVYLKQDLATVPEFIVAGYTLVLVAGLAARNWALTFIGIGLCFLSRYTCVFLMPLVCYTVYPQIGFAALCKYLCIPVLMVLVVYVWPFMSKDSTIFAKSLAWHNQCTPMGFEPMSKSIPVYYQVVFGNSFIIYFKHLWPCVAPILAAKKVRIFQLSLMCAINVLGFFWLRHSRSKPCSFHKLLLLFAIILSCFFYFSSMTFRYYYTDLHVVIVGLVMVLVLGANTAKASLPSTAQIGADK
jgi:hypothetical protein